MTLRRETSVAAALGLLLLALWRFGPEFFAAGPLAQFLVDAAPAAVLAAGMTALMIARQIDISVGAQVAVLGMAAGLLAKAGAPLPVWLLGTLALGLALGAANGALVAGLGLPPIVATLAAMALLREGLRWAGQGEFLRDLPAGFQWFGLPQGQGQFAIGMMALTFVAALAWFLRMHAGGRAVFAVGSDPEAARLAGLRPPRVVFGVYALMGGCAALAAVLASVRFSQVDPNLGDGLEMQAIAAAVVGGVAVAGGRGSLLGTLLGVLLLKAIAPAFVHLGQLPLLKPLGPLLFWEKAVQGAIILLAVAPDTWRGARRRAAA